MHPDNPGPPDPADPTPASETSPPGGAGDSTAPAGAPVATAQHVTPSRTDFGLKVWLWTLLFFGVGGLLFGFEELAGSVAVAGLFVAAQAADFDPRWRFLHYSVTWVVPFFGFLGALLCTFHLAINGGLEAPLRYFVLAAGIGAAGLSALSALRPVANTLVTLFFRTEQESHTLRLAARLTLVLFVITVPGWFVLRTVIEDFLSSPETLVNEASLQGQLLGLVILALASVGFMIRRNGRETLDRLGIGSMNVSHLGIVILGTAALYGLNAGADWIERTYFHGLWQEDQRVNEMIAAGLGGGGALLLGLTAGVGEEVTLRGALQPKLGLLVTSLLFAALHVQYSVFGIGVIFLLGLLLGWIRLRTNTTVAIAVHALYDVVAVLSVGMAEGK